MTGERFDKNDVISSTIEARFRDLQQFVGNAEVGSVRFIALSDYIELMNATEEVTKAIGRRFEVEHPKHGQRDAYDVLIADNRLRIAEHEFANFQTRVAVNKATIPGYRQDILDIQGYVLKLKTANAMRYKAEASTSDTTQQDIERKAEQATLGRLRKLRASLYPKPTK